MPWFQARGAGRSWGVKELSWRAAVPEVSWNAVCWLALSLMGRRVRVARELMPCTDQEGELGEGSVGVVVLSWAGVAGWV